MFTAKRGHRARHRVDVGIRLPCQTAYLTLVELLIRFLQPSPWVLQLLLCARHVT